MARRLYVAYQGDDLTYCTAESIAEAREILGIMARTPDPDDLRIVWKLAKLDTLSSAKVRELFGVSRQTVDNWWRKAGGKTSKGELRRRSERVNMEREARIRQVLHKLKRANQRIVATDVAKMANTSLDMVRHVADKMQLELSSWHRRPSDAELIELAKGKTWPELAAATGLRLSTLRSYIYARPELSKAIREVRAARTCGPKSHGKIDPEKLRRLHSKGLSAYAISVQLGVENMVVRYWIKKLALGGPNEPHASNRRTARHAVGSSDGGIERNE